MSSIFSQPFDPGSPPVVDEALIDRIIAAPDRSASDLLILYISSLASDLAGARSDDANDRIIHALADMAEDGDLDAAMALTALQDMGADDAPPETKAVAVGMFEQVALKPILEAAVNGELDHITAAAGLAAVKSFTEMLWNDVLDPEEMEELDALLESDADRR